MQKQKILELLQAHDQTGMEEFLHHYSPLMRYIIAPILSDLREQEECLSDVSLRIWDKIHLYNESMGSFSTWVSSITRNTAYNRAKQHQKNAGLEELQENLVSSERGPEETVLQRERIAKLNHALAKLSQKDQALIYRKYYYLQSTSQIAAELGLTERAVEGRLYRLKKRLRGEFDEW